MTTLYGIKNCDTVKKARTWLEQQQITYQFHDFRDDGLSIEQVQQWSQHLGWQQLVNKRSTTWRNLPASGTENLDEQQAIKLMLENPTLIKRPVLVYEGHTQIGFKPTEYEQLFNLS